MESMNLTKIFLTTAMLSVSTSMAQKVDVSLQRSVESVYSQWRSAMVQKNYNLWKAYTAESRQVTIYNRLVSERKAWPDSLFKIPIAPPSVRDLKAINVNKKGNTAVATYFGKINFGIGGTPSDNLMLLYFVVENGHLKFDQAEYVTLAALPEVRKQMQGGNYSYAALPGFMASGKAPEIPKQIKKRGYIAKIYVFCPGREVKVNINEGTSTHRFQNDKRAEVVIGGAFDGRNPINFTTMSLPGAKGNEALDIRVFLMSQLKGVKPTPVFQYRITPEDVKRGKKPAAKAEGGFTVTAEHVKAIMAK